MKKRPAYRAGRLLAALSVICFFAASSAWATVVTWNLNPSGTEGSVGSSSYTFSSSGYSITANGYTAGAPCTPLGLYFKSSGADLPGLGVTSTSDHQLHGDGGLPSSFIQFDLSSIIAQGLTDGKFQVGNVYDNESFVIYGSSTQGELGQQIGGVYDSSSRLSFISIADFGDYDFISIGALSGGVLPVAFQATLAAVPEMSALFPIIGLIVAVALTQLLRRRRMAQIRGGPR